LLDWMRAVGGKPLNRGNFVFDGGKLDLAGRRGFAAYVHRARPALPDPST